MNTDILKVLYIKKYNKQPEIVRLSGSGSNRKYFRLLGNPTVIGVIGSNLDENKSFISLSNIFIQRNIRVPKVISVADDFSAYLQEDLGSVALFDILNIEEDVQKDKYIKGAFEELVKTQMIPAKDVEKLCYASDFGERTVMWDLNYFKYEFVKVVGIDFNENLLEDDFRKLTNVLIERSEKRKGFMYRDFQSRNVMIYQDKSYLIDFQGGSIGPGIYDAISFLWQAKAGFSSCEREKYLKYYAQLSGLKEDEVLKDGLLFAFFRTLQVLGAYGLRGLIERKAHFITSIPAALENLRDLISKGIVDDFLELKRVCIALIEHERFKLDSEFSGLTVKVFSFSYKKGYPEDLSGNGGGFMFDCRALHNPGRYEEYKSLTGRDKPVRDFLEKRGEIQPYLKSVTSLVESAVERYVARGFSSLQVGFGCTGGQHRSVYCAEYIAKKIKEKFPMVRVNLIHREQGINEIF